MDKNIHYMKWADFRQMLEEKGISTFNLLELKRILPINPETLKKFLSRQTKRGNLVRLKKGLYCISGKEPDELLLANLLYQPSYISLEYALSIYSIVPEAVYSVTSVTTKPTREFSTLGRVYVYQKIKKQAFCNYKAIQKDGISYFMATPEKALSDYLYFVTCGLKDLNERIDWEKVKINQVKKILKKKFEVKDRKIKKVLP